MLKTLFCALALLSSATSLADTTGKITFAGDSTYGSPFTSNPTVSGQIVRGQWVQVDYAAKRMAGIVLARVYGGYHCYGYGPSCEVVVPNVHTFYRFYSNSEFTEAQGQYIEVPQNAEKLEMFFKSENILVILRYNGQEETRGINEQYDSLAGSNYSFYF